jgi:hypothetical protein
MGKLFAATLFLVTICGAGERPGVPLTGSPRLDFFGGGAPGPLAPFSRPLPAIQDNSLAPVAGEKSPWLAALLSLAVPGTGEVYAGSYLKGALFFAAEATMWVFAYSYDKKGDDQTEAYKAYANDHWSVIRYIDWTAAHLGFLNPDLTISADDYLFVIYPDESQCDPPYSCVDWAELNQMEHDIANGRLNGYTHALPYYGEQQYYELIGKYEQFSRGWDDSGDLNPELENNVPIRNTSNRFNIYSDMRAEANRQYDVAATFVNIAVVNHVLSAIDAFWSVTKLNKSLHADVRMKLQGSPRGPVPVTTANFRFDF